MNCLPQADPPSADTRNIDAEEILDPLRDQSLTPTLPLRPPPMFHPSRRAHYMLRRGLVLSKATQIIDETTQFFQAHDID